MVLDSGWYEMSVRSSNQLSGTTYISGRTCDTPNTRYPVNIYLVLYYCRYTIHKKQRQNTGRDTQNTTHTQKQTQDKIHIIQHARLEIQDTTIKTQSKTYLVQYTMVRVTLGTILQGTQHSRHRERRANFDSNIQNTGTN